MRITEHDYEAMKPLLAQLKPKMFESNELTEVLRQANEQFPIGCKVSVNFTPYLGSVISYNDTLWGFYPGVRYPVYVKIEEAGEDTHNAVGCVFEYALNQLTRIENEKQHD